MWSLCGCTALWSTEATLSRKIPSLPTTDFFMHLFKLGAKMAALERSPLCLIYRDSHQNIIYIEINPLQLLQVCLHLASYSCVTLQSCSNVFIIICPSKVKDVSITSYQETFCHKFTLRWQLVTHPIITWKRGCKSWKITQYSTANSTILATICWCSIKSTFLISLVLGLVTVELLSKEHRVPVE